MKKCPKCIEIWRQIESNSKVEATVLFFFFLKYRAVRFGLLSSEVFYVVVSAIAKKIPWSLTNLASSTYERIKEHKGIFVVVVDLLQRAEIGFLRSSESQTDSSRSAVLCSRCVPPNSKVLFFFFKPLVNVTISLRKHECPADM